MNWDTAKTVGNALQAFVTALAILIGGGWAFWKFLVQRESRAKIEFSLDLRVIGHLHGKILAEVVAVVVNRVLVRHWVSDFRFDVRYLTMEDQLIEDGERFNQQVFFPRCAIRKRSWFPPRWKGTFIDPGVRQEYTYVTAIPSDACFAFVYATFKYPDSESGFHTAQKTFNLRNQPSWRPNNALEPAAPTSE
jgi:hypothetical protein